MLCGILESAIYRSIGSVYALELFDFAKKNNLAI